MSTAIAPKLSICCAAAPLPVDKSPGMRSALPAGSIEVKRTVNAPPGAAPLSARTKLSAAAASCAGESLDATLTAPAGFTDALVPIGNRITRASVTLPARTAATASVSTKPGALTRTTTRSEAVTPASWNEPLTLVDAAGSPVTLALAPLIAAPVDAEKTRPLRVPVVAGGGEGVGVGAGAGAGNPAPPPPPHAVIPVVTSATTATPNRCCRFFIAPPGRCTCSAWQLVGETALLRC